MQDHAHPIRQRLIQTIPQDTTLDAKRRGALAYLGNRHIMHPAYQPTPRHSFSVAKWQPHSVLRPIQQAAQQAGRI